jgi:phospholipid-binding lipoprotein MlaA
MLALSACAGNIPAAPKDQRAEYDPWEPLNRRLSNFNEGFDRVTLKPLAKGYDKVMPEFVKTGVANFSDNLWGPRNIINNFLQGKGSVAGVELVRFLVNTTVGIGGLFDVAGASGVDGNPETFGETFAVWGIPDGPYVVIPLLGPRTLGGAVGIPFNFLSDPLWHVDDSTVKWTIYGIRYVDVRRRLFPAEALIEDSYDRYLAVRESFLQNWQFRVHDGDPPEDDDFYDEFLDEEEEQ